MNFSKYAKDKMNTILGFIVYCLLLVTYLKAMQVNSNVIWVVVCVSCIFFGVGVVVSFWEKYAYFRNINRIMDGLEEKYLISEVIEKPRREENLAHFRILKRANKSMLENVNQVRNAQKAYKEYIESWVHEIKIPITSSKLLCENHPSEVTEKLENEIEEIHNFVEQALFYARLDQVSNDFIIREINLGEIIKSVLARNKKIMIQNNMKVSLQNCDVTAYTDEKWLEFILHQIMMNSVQYKTEKNPEIRIEMKENKGNVVLFVRDNGIGVKTSEIDRIFEKGFTGTNGRKQKKSTGIGLYLCKRLCKELGMEIEAEAEENEFMEVRIIIPRNKKM